MNGPRNREAWREDLDALAALTAKDLPSLEQTAYRLAAARRRRSREGFLMKSIRNLKTRPWWVTAGATTAVALALLVIPIEYSRTVGYEVRIGFPEPLASMGALANLAAEFAHSLQTKDIQMVQDGSGVTLIARVPVRPRGELEAIANTFEGFLTDRGTAAHAAVVPIEERISNNFYAYAQDRVREIRVERAGKSLAELEEEIELRLEEVGFANPAVTVTEADGETRIEIEADGVEGGAEDGGETEIRMTLE